MELNEFKSFVEKGLEGVQAKQVAALQETREEWKKHYEELKAQGVDGVEAKQLVDRAIKRLDALEAELSRGNYGGNRELKTLGEKVVEDPEFLAFRKRAWHKGGVIVEVPGKTFFPQDCGLEPEFKTTITSAAVGSSTPGILTPERMPGIVKPGVRRLRVRELMSRMSTSSNAIDWVKENVFTNAASPTAETISKPESALTFVIDSANVRTLPHWIPAARQILDDFPALQSYINTRLIEGLKDVEDYELVAGDGTGQHLSGLSTEATAYDTARSVSGDTKIDRLNRAIGQIEDVLQVADGIILHPRDWRDIQLVKTEEGGTNKGSYLLGGPVGLADPFIWGLPVATTTAVTRGTFYVGNFRGYCTVWDRMDARIDISTEHADFFIRNMVAIRAEERLTFTVGRSDAVVYGAF